MTFLILQKVLERRSGENLRIVRAALQKSCSQQQKLVLPNLLLKKRWY
jgi:hypothetical protein